MNTRQKEILKQVRKLSGKNHITMLNGNLFYEVLDSFPPFLSNEQAEKDLSTLYEVGYHSPTDSLFICNKGASLLTKSPYTETESCVFHVGFCIINEKHGIEIINAGVSGDIVRSKSIVYRAESACAPSFIFGSQRCNCHDQWLVLREIAAQMNSCKFPKAKYEEHENLVAQYIQRNDGGIPVPFKTGQAFLMIHLDSQNGMGSGVNDNSYSQELTAAAFLRHRGEYSAEQIHKTTMAGGFTSIGLIPDPRSLNDNFSYKIPLIVLDYFQIDKPLIALTNNKEKIKELVNGGFTVERLLFLGRSNHHCSLETRDRIQEFEHLIPHGYEISPQQEIQVIKKEIERINNKYGKK